ncbi:MAG: DUF4783 domain-containing protein [Bacteroidetes bacterium]|nr:DUF4783 domain-containing protein [Bacteroidota bacterium]
MSRLTVILFFLWLLLPGHAICQTDPSSAITEAIKKGNSAELGKYFNEMVDLSIPGIKDSYSKQQAERIVKDFFSNWPVNSITISKEGSSPDGSKYTMGDLRSGGKKFSLFFLLRKSNGEYRIFQLHIQSE